MGPLDHRGVITRFNRACELASGHLASDVIGTNLGDNTFFEPNLTAENIKKLLSDDFPGGTWATQQLPMGTGEWTDTHPPRPPWRVYRLAPLRP